MARKNKAFNNRQLAFQELFIGTLLYAVVLGFFNDYTSIVSARSFSTIFFASIILEVLTYLTFRLKGRAITRLKNKQGIEYRALMLFCVWLIMFLSKFVFIWALDAVFGAYIAIHGFFGILFVVLGVTVVHKLAYFIFKKLGSSNT